MDFEQQAVYYEKHRDLFPNEEKRWAKDGIHPQVSYMAEIEGIDDRAFRVYVLDSTGREDETYVITFHGAPFNDHVHTWTVSRLIREVS